MSQADSSPHSPQHVNSPLQPVQNAPGAVHGIDYSGHAFDQIAIADSSHRLWRMLFELERELPETPQEQPL